LRRHHRAAPAIKLAAMAAVVVITTLATISAAPPNLEGALAAQQRLCKEHPQDPSAWNDLGNLLLLAERPQDAEAAYRQAVELDPKKVSALFNLGLLDQQQGHLKEAQEAYHNVLQIDPHHAWTLFQLGSIYERGGDRSKAVNAYSQAFSIDPQLAVPEVNPQVVESRLTTEALLRAYQNGMVKEPVRHQYDDPMRIAKLLVQQTEKPAEETHQDKTNPPRVLNSGNLPPGKNVGQVQPPNGKGGPTRPVPAPQDRPQPAYGGTPNPTPSQTPQNWNRPSPRYVSPTDGTAPGFIITPPTPLYRPVGPSTGQPNIVLTP
jgi:DNA-binding SARP family transcriptional activator